MTFTTKCQLVVRVRRHWVHLQHATLLILFKVNALLHKQLPSVENSVWHKRDRRWQSVTTKQESLWCARKWMSNRCTTFKQVNHYRVSALSGVEFPFQKAPKIRHTASFENHSFRWCNRSSHPILKRVILAVFMSLNYTGCSRYKWAVHELSTHHKP